LRSTIDVAKAHSAIDKVHPLSASTLQGRSVIDDSAIGTSVGIRQFNRQSALGNSATLDSGSGPFYTHGWVGEEKAKQL
jgi:hypothetical protein